MKKWMIIWLISSIVSWLIVGQVLAHQAISVYERYPQEWGASPQDGRFLKLIDGTVLKTQVDKEQRLTLVIGNGTKILFRKSQIFVLIPSQVTVEKTQLWILSDITPEFRSYYAGGFGDIYYEHVGGPNESFFLRFPKLGTYRFHYDVQGVGSPDGEITRRQGSFIVEVQE